ncbi:MAG: NAD(P)-dependent glycerol-3-phosphate dehydrogenase [Rhodobacteraceae bacterium]|nr:NAD(P)-dependent glycerol-3-phosphate dehydrogenase [Paracoccaceae bacterium]
MHATPERRPAIPATLPYEHVAILGSGSWGTAIAAIARRAGRKVTMWSRDADLAEQITARSRNDRYLPGIPLPDGITAYPNMGDAVKGAEAVFLVVPSRAIRSVSRQLKPLLVQPTPLVICAKGIEAETGHLMSGLVDEEAPGHPVGALSGPTFAAEAARGDYTAATVAFRFDAADRLQPTASPAARLAVSLSSDGFRPYISDDLVGVETAGALKNVIAIACGMMTGVGFAENTRAALIARGLEEMKTLTTALGGRRATVTGLAGTGDLTLTCSSQTSRNMSLGLQLGQGIARAECFDGRAVVAEGEHNAKSVHELCQRLGLNLPICETVYRILHEGADLRAAFAMLWSRPLEAEPLEMDIEIPHPMMLEATR